MYVCSDPQEFAAVDPDTPFFAFLTERRQILAAEGESDEASVRAVVVGVSSVRGTGSPAARLRT